MTRLTDWLEAHVTKLQQLDHNIKVARAIEHSEQCPKCKALHWRQCTEYQYLRALAWGDTGPRYPGEGTKESVYP